MGHVRMERGGDFVSMLTPVEPEIFKLAACRLCRRPASSCSCTPSWTRCAASNRQIEGVMVWNKAGRSRSRARQYIDCTGDGDLAA